MTPDLKKEFDALSAKARQELNDIPASGSYRHVFSIWVLPSFSPSLRYTIYSPRRIAQGRQPFVSCTIWRNDLDLEKFKSPVDRLRYPTDLAPTIEHDNINLAEGEIEQIEQQLRGVSIPIFLGQPSMDGLDGTMFEFRSGKSFDGIWLCWWEDHPKDWRPFTSIVRAIIENFEVRRKGGHEVDGLKTSPK